MKRFFTAPKNSHPILAFVVTLYVLSTSSLFGQPKDFSKVEIETIKLRDGIYMLIGAGGNIGVSAGKDGVFIIDDQFAPLSEKISSALRAITPKPVKFVLNTHWHYDHVGGNEAMGKAGAVIVAHENVRKRMSVDNFVKAFNRQVPKAPEIALPVVTFNDSVTFHMNGQTIEVVHVEPAHTDGDSFVFFKEGNVLHTGDLFTNGLYPFIDVQAGGSLTGVIKAIERILPYTNSKTKIIPGHGGQATQAELKKYLKMMKEIHASVSGMISEGKSVEEVSAAKPTSKYDKVWGKGFLTPDQFVGLVYNGIKENG